LAPPGPTTAARGARLRSYYTAFRSRRPYHRPGGRRADRRDHHAQRLILDQARMLMGTPAPNVEGSSPPAERARQGGERGVAVLLVATSASAS
jgi:hypothetical protein